MTWRLKECLRGKFENEHPTPETCFSSSLRRSEQKVDGLRPTPPTDAKQSDKVIPKHAKYSSWTDSRRNALPSPTVKWSSGRVSYRHPLGQRAGSSWTLWQQDTTKLIGEVTELRISNAVWGASASGIDVWQECAKVFVGLAWHRELHFVGGGCHDEPWCGEANRGPSWGDGVQRRCRWGRQQARRRECGNGFAWWKKRERLGEVQSSTCAR